MSEIYLGPTPFNLHAKPLPRNQSPSDSLKLIALDPGGTTGWSIISIPANSFDAPHDPVKIIQSAHFWWHGQVDCSDINQGCYYLRRNLIDRYPDAGIVFESFFLRGGQRNVDLSPVQINAVLGHHLWIRQIPYHFQQPAMAKRMDNKRLKLMNVYTSEGGLQHARDADRHVIMMIRRCLENKGWKERLWPHVEFRT
jgi:hypothetical protein